MAKTSPDTPPDPASQPPPAWLPRAAGGPGPRFHFKVWYIVLALLVASAVQDFLRSVDRVETIPYSQFREAVASGQVERPTPLPAAWPRASACRPSWAS